MPRKRDGTVRSDEARRLRRVRDELALTQRELAEQFGVASGAIAQWESGQHTVPGPVLQLIEMYELEMGLAPGGDGGAAGSELPVGWGSRTPRTAAAAVLWLLFFGTLREADSYPLLRRVRLAALRRSTQLVGDLKGLAMKLEQMTGFADIVLSPADRALLDNLRERTQPMSPAQVCQVFVHGFGKTPRQLFAEWTARPLATASIGQVHAARLADGREVAVKVQYPRIVEAIEHDLGQAAALGKVLGLFLRGQSRTVMLDEIRARMLEECDYMLEARRQREFAALFASRTDVRIPAVIPELSSRRVLTSELVHGQSLAAFAAGADAAARNRAGEIILDFYLQPAFGPRQMFNTDPNAGNFLFGPDHVTFLDFGRVKQFSPSFAANMKAIIRATLERDRARVRTLLIEMGVVPQPDRFDFDRVFQALLLFYRPYLADAPFTFTREHLQRTWRAVIRDNPNMTRTNFPADMVFLNQFHFGVPALLVRLGATVNYRTKLLDLLYAPDEARPAPFSDAELALLGI